MGRQVDVDPREQLGVRREAALRELAGLRADHAALVAAAESANADDEHDPEGATLAFERAQVAALADGLQRRVAEIDAALGLVGTPGYGVCARCGAPIGAERLAARPSALICVRCAGFR